IIPAQVRYSLFLCFRAYLLGLAGAAGGVLAPAAADLSAAGAAGGAAARSASSALISSLTSSLTTKPPESSALFQVMPQSLRSSLPVAITPFTVRPNGSLIEADGPSTASTTDLVIPCMVRSPVTLNLPLPAFFSLVEKAGKGKFKVTGDLTVHGIT